MRFISYLWAVFLKSQQPSNKKVSSHNISWMGLCSVKETSSRDSSPKKRTQLCVTVIYW